MHDPALRGPARALVLGRLLGETPGAVSTLVATARLEVRLLGRFEMRLDGRPIQLASRPAQSLFAYLVLSAGTMHRREKLAATLWPDADEENGRTYLRQALWRIRKATAPDTSTDARYLLSDELAVGFDAGASFWLDVRAFEMSTGTADALMEGLSAYRGELLPGFRDEWVILERERLEAVLPGKMERLIDSLAAERRWTDLIEWSERWISLGGVPEPAYRALIQAHHERGDRARMAGAYRRCVEALKRELDVEPSDETRQLYDRLTRAASVEPPAVGVTPLLDLTIAAAVETGAPPFKGLQHFDEADAELFFGREALVERILGRLQATPFFAIVGASGSGKSSILRAGVVPTLRRGVPALGGIRPAAPRIHVLNPTAHPLESLAVALTADTASTQATAALLDDLASDARSLRLHLRKSGAPAFLFVDQFEEVFTLCRDPFEREAFIDGLLAASIPHGEGPATVVIALRADFYAHCADHAGLRDALAEHQEYIGPMDPGELRQAIEGPAAKLGYALEPGLVDLLLHDVGDEPGALPLLSHALLETWERRRGRTLTVEGYTASGGVRGAIARTAESVFAGLTAPRQQLARRIFLRLTEFGEGTQDTRRRASVDELRSGSVDAAAVSDVLRILAGARLITTAERTVDVAHEALIREWPRLRRWLDEDRDALRAHRELTRSALEWERLGRDPGALYRGARLAQALELAAAAPEELNVVERGFVEASQEQAKADERDREAARQRELEAARRLAATERSAALKLRQRALYLTLALFFLAGMAGAALWFAEQARASTAAAEYERQRALLESSRSAAAGIDSRLNVLRDAMDASATPSLVYLIQTSDPSLQRILVAMATFGGDVVVLFVTQWETDQIVAYTTNEIIAPEFDRPLRARAERAGDAAASSAADAEERCRLLQQVEAGASGSANRAEARLLYMSPPYAPAPGDTPSVAVAKYLSTIKDFPFRQQCVPYALVAEVSLRRAGEWMVGALAPDDDAYLIDQAGRLIARARRAEIDHFRDLSGSDLVTAALASPDAVLREAADPLDGGPRLAATAPVGETGWRVIVVRSVTTGRQQLDASLEQLRPMGAFLAALLLAVSATVLVVRKRRAPA